MEQPQSPPSHNSRSPNGRPSLLHAIPQLYGGRECLHTVSGECVFKDFPCDEDVFHICVDLMSEHSLRLTNDVFEAVDLYIKLRELINNELDREH